MRVTALDHVNIYTRDMTASARFYAEVLGLDVRDGPTPGRAGEVRWVYDDQDRPIVHLNTGGAPQAFPRDCAPGPTGPIHHVALGCSGKDELIARLTARGLDHTLNRIEAINLSQVFVHDPNGVLLELNFHGQ